MTPEQAARFVRSDGQDPELQALAAREMDVMFREAMRDPEFRARFDRHIREITAAFDREIAAKVYGA